MDTEKQDHRSARKGHSVTVATAEIVEVTAEVEATAEAAATGEVEIEEVTGEVETGAEIADPAETIDKIKKAPLRSLFYLTVTSNEYSEGSSGSKDALVSGKTLVMMTL